MNKILAEIVCIRLLIVLSSETSESLMIYVQSKRISSGHKHIYSKVKFESVNKKRVFNIALYYIFIAIYNVFDVSSQKYSSTLGKCLRFNYIGSDFALFCAFKVVSKLAKLQRNSPSLRKKVVLLRKMLSHSHQIDA